jgi:integrase
MSLTMNEIKELIAMGFTPEQIAAMNGENKTKKERKVKNLRPEDKQREGQQETRALLKEEVDLFFSKLKTDQQRLLFKVIINMALRVSDAIDLKVDQIRGKNIAKVYIKKQKFTKKIKINDALKEAIELYIPKDAKDDDYLFPSPEKKVKKFSTGKYKKKGHITRMTAYNWMTKAAKAAGLTFDEESIACHGIRKYFGTVANEMGMTIAEIQAAYAHKSASTTIRYLGIDDKKVNAMYDSIQG